MATTGYGDISQRTAAYAAVQMLDHAEPVIVLQKFGMPKPMPKNKAETVKFRRPVPYAKSTVPLAEGVTPASDSFGYEDVSCTLRQYGRWSELTDKIEDLCEDPVLQDMSMMLGECAAETIEAVLYGVLRAGTNVFYDTAAHTARNEVTEPVSINRLRAVIRDLKRQKGKKLTKVLSASVNVGTSPITPAYVAVCHTDLEPDIQALTGFKSVEEYASGSPLCPEEFGAVHGIRFVTSPELEPFAGAGGSVSDMLATGGNADVYPILIFAKNAFGTVPLKGKESIKPMVLNPNEPRGGDPLGQRGSVAFKTWFAGVILNQAWMARLEVATTAL